MAKRIFQGVVLFFALYAFVFLPLGKKSALEHLRAIWATPAAQQAASEVKGGVTKLVRRLESEARKSSGNAERLLEQGDEQDDSTHSTEPKPAERKPAQRATAERDPLYRNIGTREEPEAPRSSHERLRALSAEKSARDGL